MVQVPPDTTLPELPPTIGRLRELAFNLWWSWNADATELYRRIDPEAWERLHHNPIALLQHAVPATLASAAGDEAFIADYQRVFARFDAYMQGRQDSWYARTFPGADRLIAYFCAEFGLHESLPIYSGGLGILAGDHLKASSDLGLPLVAVGLWYPQGYFHQHIDGTGRQIAEPEGLNTRSEPLQRAGDDGRDVVITVRLLDRTVHVRVWLVQVGRVPLFLLDTDLPENSEADRALLASLYGGDRETRIQQEIVLGVGGVRALRALRLAPTQWHMNEGHAGFMGLERIRDLVQGGTPFVDAWPEQAESTIFTTHTPVPAGNEVFRHDLVQRYFTGFPEQMGLDMPGMLALAHEEATPDGQFAMTPLALRLSHRANGVSKLHGAVARHMWAKQFPEFAEADVPITSVTNGVHTATWVSPALGALYAHYLGEDWLERVDDPLLWQAIAAVPDAELWAIHNALKARLIALVREQHAGTELGRSIHIETERLLDPRALTIGFARRFATYKRATLFFRDLERAVRLLADAERPIQLVFAGKAHPADGGGQALIKQIIDLSRLPQVAGKVVFLEGYDIALARELYAGVDVWLNNPERPQEASGTSGMKASLNGAPNLSIRDGWWDEGYNGANGWAFGAPVGDDAVDSAELYDVLETAVLPTFYERDEQGLPKAWIAIMKEAIRTVAPQFSAQRMVKEYTQRLYR